MYVYPHRSKASFESRVRARTLGDEAPVQDDEEYDSLWSDSEEEEFPVNPSSSENYSDEVSSKLGMIYARGRILSNS